MAGLLLSLVLTLALLGAARPPSPDADVPVLRAPRADTTERDTTERDTTRRANVAADTLIAAMRDSVRVQELFGNVRVQQDSTRIHANHAVRYLERREYLFTGDVVVFERGDTLNADSVRYDEIRKIGMARGNVRLTDGDLLVRAPSGRYFSDEKRSVFREGVTLVDSTSTLISEEGEYFSEEERAEFYGNVRFEDVDTYLEADSVTYFRETGGTVARGRVFIDRTGEADDATAAADTAARTYLFGRYAENERESARSRVRGNAFLVQIRTDSMGAPEDTMLVRAHRLEATRNDSLRRLTAIDTVRIWQRDIAATADSAVYDRIARGDTLRREETRLYRDPVAWFEESQVFGDTIRVAARDRSVDTVFVYGNAFAAQQDTTLDRIQQLKGRTITAYFRADSLRRIRTEPNAETIRFLKDEQGALDGAVKASADEIVMWFEEGDIRRVGVYTGVQSEVYDRGLVPDPFELEGFRWTPEQQPTKGALLDDKRVRQRLRGDALVLRPVLVPRPDRESSPTPLPSNPQP